LDTKVNSSWGLNEPIGLIFWIWEGKEFRRQCPNTWALSILNDVLAKGIISLLNLPEPRV